MKDETFSRLFRPEFPHRFVEDRFPVGWHPHLGMDIMTYIREGRGRHADSLGNREELLFF